MAKIDKRINEHRMNGARWVIDYIKQNGIEAAELELQKRGNRKFIPMEVNMKDIDDFVEYTKDNTLSTVLLMSATVLRDEFDFGQTRINRFVERFNEKVDCMVSNYITWDDLCENMKDECGIDFNVSEKKLGVNKES